MHPLPIPFLAGKVIGVPLVNKYGDEVMGYRTWRLRPSTPPRIIKSVGEAGIDQRLAGKPLPERSPSLGSRQTENDPARYRHPRFEALGTFTAGCERVAIQALGPRYINNPCCVKRLAHMKALSFLRPCDAAPTVIALSTPSGGGGMRRWLMQRSLVPQSEGGFVLKNASEYATLGH